MNDTMKSCYQQLNTFVDYYLGTLHLVLEEMNDFELIEHAVISVENEESNDNEHVLVVV